VTLVLAHRRALVNGIHLHWVEAGEGPLVILLHGFPEFWYAWRHQIPALAAAGLRVIALDLRGFGESERPPGIGAYRVPLVAADVAALIAHESRGGAARAAVVGHDLGGIVAYALAARHPEVVDRLAILNAPHPAALAREGMRPAQLLASWYVLFFQLPLLPELAIRARDFRVLRDLFRREPARPGAFTEDDIERYVEELRKPGALTAAINYYRAALRRRGGAAPAARQRRVEAPTLVIWGDRERHMVPEMTEGLERWVPNVRVEHLPGASHWVQHDEPERVSELIIDFLAR
jgi:pimeloyl-ACP methyl ester carboxylesterase